MKDQLRHNESQRRKEGRKEPPARDAQQEPSNRSFDPSVPPSLMATSRWLPVRLASPLTTLALGLLVLSLSLSVAGASCCATGSSGHCCTTTQWPFVRHEPLACSRWLSLTYVILGTASVLFERRTLLQRLLPVELRVRQQPHALLPSARHGLRLVHLPRTRGAARCSALGSASDDSGAPDEATRTFAAANATAASRASCAASTARARRTCCRPSSRCRCWCRSARS